MLPGLTHKEIENLNRFLTSKEVRWTKYWSFSFSISPSNEYSGLIYFRMDWLDLLAVQGLSRVFANTTVQKHQFFGLLYGPDSAFFMVQISHPYTITGKTIALTM